MRRFTPYLAVPLILVAMNATTLVADWGRQHLDLIGTAQGAPLAPLGFFRTRAAVHGAPAAPAATRPCDAVGQDTGNSTVPAMHPALLLCRPDSIGNRLPFLAI